MRRGLSRSLLFLVALALGFPSAAFPQHPYRLEGKAFVRDAKTGVEEPVAGTTLRVLIESEMDGPKRVLTGVSDEQGNYSIEVPIGHAWSFVMMPPPGYVAAKFHESEGFATTNEKPVFIKNHELKKAHTFGIQLRGDEDAKTVEKMASVMQQIGADYFNGYTILQKDGTGVLTIPLITGKYDLYVAATGSYSQLSAPGSIEFEGAFDLHDVNNQVDQRKDGSYLVKSSKGGSATLIGCVPSIQDKKLTLLFDVDQNQRNAPKRRVTGRIVDSEGKGIEKAHVDILVIGACREIVTTNEKGEFSIEAPYKAAQVVNLMIGHPRFAARSIENLKLNDGEKEKADLGTQKLSAGSSIQVKVVDKEGQPLQGAIVEPVDNIATRMRIARTDEKGECVLSGLAPEMHRLSIRFGRKYAQHKLPLKAGKNEPIVFKVTEELPIAGAVSTEPVRKPALAVGTQAPDWKIAEWTDGKVRSLTDYRGKVVVLDFWGVWCGPCISAVPGMKALETKFKDQPVVFVAIHTAGTEMDLVKRHLEKLDWHCAIGIDEGDDIASGVTTGEYHIRGYPTTIVLGRDGKIVYTTDMPTTEFPAQMKRMEAFAKALELPWPLDGGLDQAAEPEKYAAEMSVRLNKLLVALLSEEIEGALTRDGQ